MAKLLARLGKGGAADEKKFFLPRGLFDKTRPKTRTSTTLTMLGRTIVSTMLLLTSDALSHNPGAGLSRRHAILAGIVPAVASARPEGVNKPELLPPKRLDGSTPKVIDVGVNYLTKGQMKRLEQLIADLEKSAGWKVRVLAQQYPETPGLAVKDFWNVDDMTIVLVADKGLKGTSNILNFNVGSGFSDALPNVFWSRLQSSFGTSRYYRDKGEDVAIMNAVEAIVYCAPDGCISPPAESLLAPKLGL